MNSYKIHRKLKMSIENIIKNQDILDCWKEIQKSNSDKNISKGIFGYTEEELGIPYQDLEDETDAIIDIGTLLTYLIDLIFLFKESKNYMKYLTQRLYYSEIHAKEFIDYEKNIIKNL